MDDFRAVAVIPVYNNGRTVTAVINAIRPLLPDIIAVDDGSTDETAGALGSAAVEALTVDRNRGKGNALRLGFAAASARGFTHAITIDADGQHGAEDVAAVIEAARAEPSALWIGNRVLDSDGIRQPARSRLGARFGSYWYRFHTGLRISDTQCGLSAYPLHPINSLSV